MSFLLKASHFVWLKLTQNPEGHLGFRDRCFFPHLSSLRVLSCFLLLSCGNPEDGLAVGVLS